KARLGETAVYKLSYQDSRVPELTNAILALSEKCNQELPDIHRKALRPTWLLSNPEAIEERENRLYWHGYLSTLAGPERVIGQWWEGTIARDYYLAKRHDNVPVWIFFNLMDKSRYVHGGFALCATHSYTPQPTLPFSPASRIPASMSIALMN